MTNAGTPTVAGTRAWQGLSIPEPGRFVLDKAHTRIGFVARHLMVTKVRGQFRDFSGTIVVAPDPLQSTAGLNIKTTSIETGSDDRDKHLKTNDFLEIEKYPEITFENARVSAHKGNELTVVGDLTIRGVTRSVELNVEFEGVAASPWGKQVVGFSIKTEIDREDFGMTWNVALETGGVLVSRKVQIEIEGEAVRAD